MRRSQSAHHQETLSQGTWKMWEKTWASAYPVQVVGELWRREDCSVTICRMSTSGSPCLGPYCIHWRAVKEQRRLQSLFAVWFLQYLLVAILLILCCPELVSVEYKAWTPQCWCWLLEKHPDTQEHLYNRQQYTECTLNCVQLSLEMFDAFVHGFEGSVDVVTKQLRINVDQWVIHPALMPAWPVGCCQPHVLVELKVSHQTTNSIILQKSVQVNHNIKSIATLLTAVTGASKRRSLWLYSWLNVWHSFKFLTTRRTSLAISWARDRSVFPENPAIIICTRQGRQWMRLSDGYNCIPQVCQDDPQRLPGHFVGSSETYSRLFHAAPQLSRSHQQFFWARP